MLTAQQVWSGRSTSGRRLGDYAVGYDNPSQFSREYRRRFGAPPSQDAARLRRSVRTATAVLP